MARGGVGYNPGAGASIAEDTVDNDPLADLYGKVIQIVKLDVGDKGISKTAVGALPIDMYGDLREILGRIAYLQEQSLEQLMLMFQLMVMKK